MSQKMWKQNLNLMNLALLLHMTTLAMSMSMNTNMVTLQASDTLFSGRFREDVTSGALQFDMPGCSFTFIVENTSTVVLDMSQVGPVATESSIIENGGMELLWPDKRNADIVSLSEGFLYPNCFEVFIDNVLVSLDGESEYHSFCTTSWNQDGSSNLITLPLLDETVSHVIQVFKSSEAQFNSIVIEPNYVTLNQINLYGTATPSSTSPEVPTRRIEFLGDSITAGYCNLCDETSESGVFAESHLESWATLVAEKLTADFHSAAWSGYGMVNNCCGGNTTMPMIYPRALASVSDAMWDFSTWIPQAVVINLGTNDISSGHYDEEVYAQTYGDLLANMTHYYGDQTSYFLACGPMANRYCDGVKTVIATYNSNPANTPTAYFLNQTSLDLNMNCCGHPTADDDIVMADYTANFIMDTIGWS